MLDELRSRCGLLIAAASLTTAFLGAAALGHSGFDTLAALASLAFVAVLGLALWVLMPQKTWKFSLGAAVLLDDWQNEKCGTVVEMQAFVARKLEENWNSNDTEMQSLYQKFAFATVLLGIDALLWTLKLA